jgi:hypothetical protein
VPGISNNPIKTVKSKFNKGFILYPPLNIL